MTEANEKEQQNATRRGAVEQQKLEVESRRRALEEKKQEVVGRREVCEKKNQLQQDLEDQAGLYESEKKRLMERLMEQEVVKEVWSER